MLAYPSQHYPRAVTLIEVLVSVSICALLFAIVLPAIHYAREAGRKVGCSNNIRQIGLATLNYDSVWGGYPPAFTLGKSAEGLGRCYSPQSLLLPYLNYLNCYNSINFNGYGLTASHVSASNFTMLRTSISAFNCPSDRVALSQSVGTINYRGNLGTCRQCKDDNAGAFFFGGLASHSSFADGFSQTLAYSEKPVSTLTADSLNLFTDWGELLETNGVFLEVNEWCNICAAPIRRTALQNEAGRSWLIGGAVYTHFYSALPPNSAIPDCGNRSHGGVGLFTARSYHAGGVTACMADGSVRTVRTGINPDVWRALSTRGGGEVNTLH